MPARYQHRVLFWGVLGALVMRAIMIFLGSALIQRFEWIIYIFGAFLVYTGIKMFVSRKPTSHGAESVVKFVTADPITATTRGKILTRVDGG